MSTQTNQVQLFNTLSREVEQLKTLKPDEVKIYCCGPTVYDFQHIGNMRTYLFEDLLVRTLRYVGYKVNHVMNITDVGHLVSDQDDGEDKMLVAARREKKKSFEIAKRYTDKFFEDCATLKITRPNTVCNATDHIQEMIELIQSLEKRGFTYISGGNVYFDVEKCPDYGKLAQLNLENLRAGARVAVDNNKRSPFDFVLWFTKSKFEDQELQWESPWGKGYPGWHIECSAMSMKYLGEQFDIHCGGIDHIPVHHTNEIAQSESSTGKPWVKIWMHGEFLLLNREKMAKSKGTFLVLDDVAKNGYDPLAYRVFCLSGHYRQQINFSWEAIEGANNTLRKLRESVLNLRQSGGSVIELTKVSEAASMLRDKFISDLTNDLNAPKAFSTVWEVVNAKEISPSEKLTLLLDFDLILGLDLSKVEVAEIPQEVLALVKQREVARQEKRWGDSDALRAEIDRIGYVVKDVPGGSMVTKKL